MVPSNDWLDDALTRLSAARVTVFGDFCLDAYWIIDADESERSVETNLPVSRVRRQRYGLGGAGNVVANLVGLGVAAVRCVGLIGGDLFGREMLRMLQAIGAETAGMLTGREGWQTMVYAKPHVGNAEHNRIDFGAFNALDEPSMSALQRELDLAAAESDIVVLNQQVPAGISPAAMIERINAVIAARPGCRFLVDSRHRAGLYCGAMLKMNAHEAAAVLGRPEGDQPRGADLARDLHRRIGQPVFLTRGADGIVVADADAVAVEPGIAVAGATDPVGAGDTVTAALAAVLGSGGRPAVAAKLANLAASVTVRKLRTTGTATPDEIRAAAAAG